MSRLLSPTELKVRTPYGTHTLEKGKADERTRTVNLLITNQLLCQLSHIGLVKYLES